MHVHTCIFSYNSIGTTSSSDDGSGAGGIIGGVVGGILAVIVVIIIIVVLYWFCVYKKKGTVHTNILLQSLVSATNCYH